MNAMDHNLNNHKKCRDYFCSGPKLDVLPRAYYAMAEKVQLVATLKKFQGLKKCCKSWIAGKTTSNCESINATVNKLNMGKRVDLSGRGSYERRAKLAVIQRSCGNSWILELHSMIGVQTSDSTKDYVCRTDGIAEYQKSFRKLRSTNPNSR
jgi:hypothetical protein